MIEESNVLSDNDEACLKFFCEKFLEKSETENMQNWFPTEDNQASLSKLVTLNYLTRTLQADQWSEPTDKGLDYYFCALVSEHDLYIKGVAYKIVNEGRRNILVVRTNLMNEKQQNERVTNAIFRCFERKRYVTISDDRISDLSPEFIEKFKQEM